MQQQPVHRSERQGESGTALIFSLLFTTVVLGVVMTGTLTLKSQITQNRVLFVTNYQAVMAARSGLTEAISWLRRQTSQPVSEFEPVLDLAAEPALVDTEEPDIGLVRDFQIAGELWARYEVWKEWDEDPDPDRLAWRKQFESSDVSALRVTGAPGTAWRLRSVGYVYRRIDETAAFNEFPNVVLATEMTETDVLRAVLTLPGYAAVNVGDGNSTHINTQGRIKGNDKGGIYFPAGSGRPTTGSRKQQRVTGSPRFSEATTYDDSYEAVFGMTFAELSSMADMIVTNEADFPVPVPENSLIIVDVGTAFTIDSSRPLLGNALVIVKGTMKMLSGNNSLFHGLLYVDGNLTMRGPSEIHGSVIVTGNMTVQGQPGTALINFDEDAINNLISNFGTYRRVNSIFLPRRNR